MALIECNDCGQNVSKRAAVCPGCGCPVGSKGRSKPGVKLKGLGGVFEFVGFVMIALGVVSCTAGNSEDGTVGLVAVGFVVFIAGRFMR